MGEFSDAVKTESPFYRAREKKGKKGPSATYKLTYDSPAEGLEPIYFWLLDFMNTLFGGKAEKIVDNFASSPGSGHFSELGQKASQMQQEASRVLGLVNTILKGVINLLYDLKEFKVRLSHYNAAKSNEKSKREAGILALKQVWMDRVDIQRGAGSINQLTAGDLNFVTLRDAFLHAKSAKEADKIDVNERVKRILKPRLLEFEEWQKTSEEELQKRYEIERIYLKSQVEALKLNARWAKPYLRAAQQLVMDDSLTRDAALVTAFNTILLQLTLKAERKLNVDDLVYNKKLPYDFKRLLKNRKLRDYYTVALIDFRFRGIPTRQGQHYVFGGKGEVTFTSYVLNEDELLLVKEKLDQSDIHTALQFIQGMTDDSLNKLTQEIEEYIGEEKKEGKKSGGENPFTALFSGLKEGFKSIKKKEDPAAKLKKLKERGIRKDSYAEQFLRNYAEADAINTCWTLYETYKKVHGMPSFPYIDDIEPKPPRTPPEKLFGYGK